MDLLDQLAQQLEYGSWGMALAWFLLFSFFIAFIPFNRKSHSKPASIYVAFIVASALEMFGIPLSLYVVTWIFGVTLPRGLLWGHTFENYIGYWGMYIGILLNLLGGALIILGWREIYNRYWKKEDEGGELVKDGVYSYMRHPQYTGFILMTLGLLVHWATLPLLIMWPILVLQYYRLAKKEEEEMIDKFGEEYEEYRRKVPMFLPRPKIFNS